MKLGLHKGCTVSPLTRTPRRAAQPYTASLRAPNKKLAASQASDRNDILFMPHLGLRMEAPPVRVPKDNRILLEDLIIASEIRKPVTRDAAPHRHAHKMAEPRVHCGGSTTRVCHVSGKRLPADAAAVSTKTGDVIKTAKNKCGVQCDWNTDALAMVKHPNLFPEHSLHLRWPSSLHIQVHTPHAVAHLMSRYGPINYIGKAGNNSVVVVMKDVKGAQRAMDAVLTSPDSSRLICDWLFPHMNNLAEQTSLRTSQRRQSKKKDNVSSKSKKKDSVSSKLSHELRHFQRTQDYVANALDTYCQKMIVDLRQDFIP